MSFLSDAEESLGHQDKVIRRQGEALAEIRGLCEVAQNGGALVDPLLILRVLDTSSKGEMR